MTEKKYLTRTVLSVVFAAGLMFATGKATSADKDWGPACHDRLEAARAKIDQDVARHGKDSPQVRHDVDRMEAARQWCRGHHADWDHGKYDAGIYIKL